MVMVHGILKCVTLECLEDHPMIEVVMRWDGEECHIHVVTARDIFKSMNRVSERPPYDKVVMSLDAREYPDPRD